LLNALNRQQ
jgi:hypothetical protein